MNAATWWAPLPPEPSSWAEWATFTPAQQPTSVLTSEECDEVWALVKDTRPRSGRLQADNHEDSAVRDVAVRDLAYSEDSVFVFEKIWNAVAGANARWWDFHISHLQAVEVLHYGLGGHYRPHVDRGEGYQTRKLSAVVLLSDPADYDGGELVLHPAAGEPVCMPKEQGSIVVFPSWLLHGVNPVTRGSRRTVTAWVQGPAFR